MGFVTKQAAENLLLQKGVGGCFLLRFSDSELGGVTIAYVTSDVYRKFYVLKCLTITMFTVLNRTKLY